MRRSPITCGVLAVLIGLGFVFPQIARWREQGSVEVILLLLGLLMSGGGIWSIVHGIRSAWA